MKSKFLLGTMSLIISFGATAGMMPKINESSSWDEILSQPNLDFGNDWVRINGVSSSVFFVEEKDGYLYTKKPTTDGYYKKVNSSSQNERQVFIKTGQSIKKGSVDIRIPVYEKAKRGDSDNDDRVLVGYKEVSQPLTRMINVYKVKKENGDRDRETKTLLFKKEYTVPKKDM